MALPATADFTGTNGDNLETAEPGFDNVFNAFTIQDNQAIGTVNADTRAIWTADSFSADQYSKAVISGMSSGSQYRGVVARASGADGTYNDYTCFSDGGSGSGHTEIGKTTNGSYAMLKAVATTFSDTDEIEIRVTGTSTTTVEMWKNESQIDTVDDSSSPHTSGAAGIYAYGSGTPGIDDWEADDLASGPAAVTGTGALTSTQAATSGTGTVDGGLQEITGTGALTGPSATASGAASRGLHDVPGPIALASSIPTVAGTGTVDTPSVPDTGTGALTAAVATASGLGIRGITGSGACSIVMPSVRGFEVLPVGRTYQEFGFGLQMRF
jgi:hypothetical protein